MPQEKEDSSMILMDTVVSKLEQQDQKIKAQEKKMAGLEQQVSAVSDPLPDLSAIKAGMQEILATLKNLRFPTETVQELSKRLAAALDLLRAPAKTNIEHHHHIPKVIWATGGLFLALCIVCSGWFTTCNKLGEYQGGDIKYRSLKLNVDSAALVYLYRLDSFYLANPDSLRKNVEDQERLRAERIDLLNQIQAVERKIPPPGSPAAEKKRGRN
jgi:hypothetical protein